MERRWKFLLLVGMAFVLVSTGVWAKETVTVYTSLETDETVNKKLRAAVAARRHGRRAPYRYGQAVTRRQGQVAVCRSGHERW